jgi:hypothetical protein
LPPTEVFSVSPKSEHSVSTDHPNEASAQASASKRWGSVLTYSLDKKDLAKVIRCIDNLLSDPKGLPNGKGKRTKLSTDNAQKFKSALIHAAEYAAVWASKGPLSNRVRGRGRPPDNAVLLFIDDIVRACEVAGLKPGLRYVKLMESLPVRVFIELGPLLWPGSAKAPRRLFERWQRLRGTLARG